MSCAVVVNADDLGYSDWRDQGIFRAYHQGLVTSASLLVNGASAAAAAQRAIREGLDIGLHLNLTEGRPLTDLTHIPQLLTPDSKLMYKESFWQACSTAQATFFEQVGMETIAQLLEFKRLTGGIAATHLDGHQHIHVAPGIAQILAPILSSYGIVTTRIPEENIAALTWVSTASRQRWQGRVESARASRAIYAEHGIYAPDYFLGQGFSGAHMSMQRILVSVRRQLPLRGGLAVPQTTGGEADKDDKDDKAAMEPVFSQGRRRLPTAEIMVHPGGGGEGEVRSKHMRAGCGDGVVDSFALSCDRQHEAKVLCAPQLQSTLMGPEHKLVFCNWKRIHDYHRHWGKSSGGGESSGGSSSESSGGSSGGSSNGKSQEGDRGTASGTQSSSAKDSATKRITGSIRVLLLAIGLRASGNLVTALRIRQNLADVCHFDVTLVDATNATTASVLDTVRRNRIQVVVGLHAYHAGKLLYTTDERTQELMATVPVPVIIVAGGTDLNNGHSQTQSTHPSLQVKRHVVQQSLIAADAVVVFNEALRDRAARLMEEGTGKAKQDHPESNVDSTPVSKLFVIPQAVDVSHQAQPWLRKCLGLAAHDVLILLPSGIRPVKDPLFIVSLFQAWVHQVVQQQEVKEEEEKPLQSSNGGRRRKSTMNVRLVVMGSVRDATLMSELCKVVTETMGGAESQILCDAMTRSVIYHPPVSHDLLLAAIGESNVLLNTSLSEGMANVLLEAMALGVPIVARRNEGNCALVGAHKERGDLFTTAEECIEIIARGWHAPTPSNQSLMQTRIEAAWEYIQASHSCQAEAQLYGSVVGLCC